MAITITVSKFGEVGPAVLRDGADWQAENATLSESQQPFATPVDDTLLAYTINPGIPVYDPFQYNPPVVLNLRDFSDLNVIQSIAVTTNGTANATTQSNVAVTGGTGAGLTVDLTATGGVFTDALVNSQGNGMYTDGDVVTAPAATTGADADATLTLTVVPLFP